MAVTCNPKNRTSQEIVIDVRHLSTRFGTSIVHEHLNLSIRRGEILSVVGGSGTGTTVLLRQMLKLEQPSEGCITIFGVDINHASASQIADFRSRSGMLFQQGALYSALSVFNNVAQPMRELHVLPESLIRDAVYLKLDMAGIGPEHALKMPASLSGGMVKRVALARALALEPDILFLDEPTAGLDPNASESFVSLIQSLHREMGFTVVMVTHDLDTLVALSSRIAVLADRRVITVGTIDEVIQVPHPFIQEFFLGARGRRALTVLDKDDYGK